MDVARLVQNLGTKHKMPWLTFSTPVCVKLPSLGLRFLFQQEGLPLGRIVHLVGDEASFKTTFSAEIVRWHMMNAGGGITLHTEGRPNEDVLNGVFGELADKHAMITCQALEDWQGYLIGITKQLREDPGLLCCVVDSILGSAARSSIEDVESNGFASSRFATEARLIADFLRSFTRSLVELPMTLVIINHRKIRPSGVPYAPPQKTSLGGNEIRYYTSFEVEMSRSAVEKTLTSDSYFDVTLKTTKNTYGRPEISITVPVVITGNPPTVIFRWCSVTASLLTDFSGIKPHPSAAFVKQLKEVINVESRRAGSKGLRYYSQDLGIAAENAVTDEELELAIEERADLLEPLYGLLGIARRYIYDSNLSWDQNRKAAIKRDEEETDKKSPKAKG